MLPPVCYVLGCACSHAWLGVIACVIAHFSLQEARCHRSCMSNNQDPCAQLWCAYLSWCDIIWASWWWYLFRLWISRVCLVVCTHCHVAFVCAACLNVRAVMWKTPYARRASALCCLPTYHFSCHYMVPKMCYVHHSRRTCILLMRIHETVFSLALWLRQTNGIKRAHEMQDCAVSGGLSIVW